MQFSTSFLENFGTVFAVSLSKYQRQFMPENILIIDKNTGELRRLREILTREGYSVMTATDTETAKQICQRIPIRFVLGEAKELGCGEQEQKKIWL